MADEVFYLKNDASGRHLCVTNGNVSTREPYLERRERWVRRPVANGCWTIESLDETLGGTTRLQAWESGHLGLWAPRDDWKSQLWSFRTVGSSYTVMNAATFQVLDGGDGIRMLRENGSASQRWRFQATRAAFAAPHSDALVQEMESALSRVGYRVLGSVEVEGHSVAVLAEWPDDAYRNIYLTATERLVDHDCDDENSDFFAENGGIFYVPPDWGRRVIVSRQGFTDAAREKMRWRYVDGFGVDEFREAVPYY